MAEDTEKPRSFRWLSWVIAVVIALSLLYILGSGPAIVVIKKYPAARQPLGAVYEPLGWAVEKTPLRKPLLAYIQFWADMAVKF